MHASHERRRGEASKGSERARREPTRPPVAAATALLLGSIIVSQAIPWSKLEYGSDVPPLFARLSPEIGPGIAIPLLLAAGGWFGLRRASTWPLPWFLGSAVVFAWFLSVALAAQEGGVDKVAEPFLRDLDYYANVPLVEALGPATFIERYAELGPRLSLHARTHPPGAPLLLWVLSELTGGSVLAIALITALLGAASIIPAFVLARDLFGERTGRNATILFAVAPGVLLFLATSMDAVFMTLIAFPLAALVRAAGSDSWAVAAGALTGLALLFTYGAVAVGIVAIGIGFLAQRGRLGGSRVPAIRLVRRGLLALAVLVSVMVVLRFTVGLDLPGAFRAALTTHVSDSTFLRPYPYWVIANIPAFLLMAGTAQTALVVMRTRVAWRARRAGMETVLWGSLVAASASGMFLGEVDHIWLFFIPLVTAVAAAGLSGDGEDRPRAELLPSIVAFSLTQAVLMEVILETYW